MLKDLTRDQLLEMEPGFGLNLLVGEEMGYNLNVPDYSQDISETWNVVAAANRYYDHWLHLKTPCISGEPYQAAFAQHGCETWNHEHTYGATGKSVPEAICKAFLLMIQGRKGNEQARS